jgi:small conductance mechanosensitive channel
MRRLCLSLFVFLLAGAPAGAQTALPSLALHQPFTTPAKAAASAIIPGSPLAALTGAAPAAAPPSGATPQNAPDPFGSDSFGLSIIDHITAGASSTVFDFAAAIQHSTELTPVFHWLKTYNADPIRRARLADAFMGLLLVILPALLAEFLVRAALARPRAALTKNALARRKIDFPDQDSLDNAERGDIEAPSRKVSLIAWLRRFSLAIVFIFLVLLPVLAFAGLTGILLATSLIGTHSTHLIVTLAGNAYLLWRMARVILTFLYAPEAEDFRLIHTTNRRAAWLVTSFSNIVVTIAAGFWLVATAEVLGLPHANAQVLALDIGLFVHIEAAILIWQSRHIVAGWIRGQPDEAKIAFGIRPRLAAVWHFIALFYVLAIWVAYAAGVHNAFGVLLRVVVVFVGALVGARLTWFGFVTGLDRLLDEETAETRSHPMLRERIRAYKSLLKLTIRIIVLSLVIAFMLQGWGVNVIPWLLRDPLSRALINAFIAIVITVAIAIALWEFINYYIKNRIENLAQAGKTRQASRLKTLLPMLKASIGVTIFLTAALICLSQIGVNLVPLLAISGVAGIAIGFGSQKLVQDIITGLFLLLEDAIQVGDTVTLAGMSGTVEQLSIRTIRLRGGDGSINIIPFSAVTTVTNMTRDFGYAQISIEVAYDEDLDHVSAVLTDIAKKMRAEPQWGAQMRDDLQIFGLDQFGASGLVITGQIRTGPGQHWAVRREFYARVKARFEAEHIEMPYTYLPPAPPRPGPADVGHSESKQDQGASPPEPPARAKGP